MPRRRGSDAHGRQLASPAETGDRRCVLRAAVESAGPRTSRQAPLLRHREGSGREPQQVVRRVADHLTQRLVVAVAALTALALPAAASAHANLVRTVPADRAALSKAPGQILVVFDDVVRVGPGNEAVRNGSGSILAGAPRAQGKTLELPLR